MPVYQELISFLVCKGGSPFAAMWPSLIMTLCDLRSPKDCSFKVLGRKVGVLNPKATVAVRKFMVLYRFTGSQKRSGLPTKKTFPSSPDSVLVQLTTAFFGGSCLNPKPLRPKSRKL